MFSIENFNVKVPQLHLISRVIIVSKKSCVQTLYFEFFSCGDT